MKKSIYVGSKDRTSFATHLRVRTPSLYHLGHLGSTTSFLYWEVYRDSSGSSGGATFYTGLKDRSAKRLFQMFNWNIKLSIISFLFDCFFLFLKLRFKMFVFKVWFERKIFLSNEKFQRKMFDPKQRLFFELFNLSLQC